MAFTFPRGTYNARASFNRWLRVNITANGWPAAHPAGFGITFEHPDVPLPFPSFSVHHLGEFDGQRFQGDRVRSGLTGSYRYALTEVSCWASGDASAAWSRDLWQMSDMVTYLCQSARSIPLLNVYGSTANPTSIGIMRLGPGTDVIAQVEAPMEPSPNVHRARHLIRWWYQQNV
jgi:hypothetical protein